MMKNLRGVLAIAAGVGLTVAGGSASAATECNGPLSGAVTDGVVVNAGDVCVLGGATVSGGVRVNAGGILIVCGSTINDGINSFGAANVLIGPEEILGCTGNLIRGGVRISNSGPGVLQGPPSIAVENSRIQGGVHLTGNQGAIGVVGNVISGGLFCKNNTAATLNDEGVPSVISGAVTCKVGDDE